MTNSRKQVLKRLFVSTLYLSTFTFGGGYVIISLMKKKFVDEYHWIEEEEMLDLTAIAQSAPGAVAVNGAIVVGYKLAGAAGVLISILGTVIPPFVILSLISVCYQAFRENWLVSHMLEGMQAGVGAVIASVTYEMGAGVLKEKDFLSVWILAGAFFTSVFLEINVVWIVLVCAGIGVLPNPCGKEEKSMIYLQLFFSFLQIGMFSFGGGYAAMPLIQGQVVKAHAWLSMAEFTDLITISQMTPGPIAVNSATFVGLKIAGVFGAFAATLGCILPSCIIVTIIARLYLKYRKLSMLQGILKSLRPAVVAMIGAAGISVLWTAFGWVNLHGISALEFVEKTDWSLVVIFVVCLVLLRKKKNPVAVMVAAGVMKTLYAFVTGI